MTREEKKAIIDTLVGKLGEYPHFYLTDISGLNAEQTAALRGKCFEKDIKLVVVKNTLFTKALEQAGLADEQLVAIMEGSSAVMFSASSKAPALLIKEFRKKNPKPLLKGAYVQQGVYIGEDQLDALVNIKSREELIGDIIGLLQSPAKNVISALQSAAGGRVAGLVKSLEEKKGA
jgi:large subunit ribosomal protein L10